MCLFRHMDAQRLVVPVQAHVPARLLWLAAAHGGQGVDGLGAFPTDDAVEANVSEDLYRRLDELTQQQVNALVRNFPGHEFGDRKQDVCPAALPWARDRRVCGRCGRDVVRHDADAPTPFLTALWGWLAHFGGVPSPYGACDDIVTALVLEHLESCSVDVSRSRWPEFRPAQDDADDWYSYFDESMSTIGHMRCGCGFVTNLTWGVNVALSEAEIKFDVARWANLKPEDVPA